MRNSRINTLLPLFIICVSFILFIIFLSQKTNTFGISIVELLFAPLQKTTLHLSQATHTLSTTDKLISENNALRKQLAQEQTVMQDNQALRDQFQLTNPSSQNLLPAQVVSMPSFLPGISAPEKIVIDKGVKDNIGIGNPIIVKNNLLGKVSKVNGHFAEIVLITNKSSSFTAKTTGTGAIGIIKGIGGGQMILDNVVLSDTLQVGDTVVTSGDIDLDGNGFPPALVIGKITSVEKNPSALFQKANIQPLLDITQLSLVFVYLPAK